MRVSGKSPLYLEEIENDPPKTRSIRGKTREVAGKTAEVEAKNTGVLGKTRAALGKDSAALRQVTDSLPKDAELYGKTPASLP